ncbi:alpha/beta hydrolase [Vibrio toranzoniae]|nr:alpha/beta hydrolase [Vibrio toranzoniae]
MKRLILNITLLVFMALGSMNAIAHDSKVKYGIAISHDGEQIAYGKSGSGETALIFIHGWSLDSRLWQNQVRSYSAIDISLLN